MTNKRFYIPAVTLTLILSATLLLAYRKAHAGSKRARLSGMALQARLATLNA